LIGRKLYLITRLEDINDLTAKNFSNQFNEDSSATSAAS
jgi:hypothetical protein